MLYSLWISSNKKWHEVYINSTFKPKWKITRLLWQNSSLPLWCLSRKKYFTSVNHYFTFFINKIKCSTIICYDIRIPELIRDLTLNHDVKLVLHCGVYFRDESFFTWHQFAITRALENQIFLLNLNRAGKKFGNSIFVLLG